MLFSDQESGTSYIGTSDSKISWDWSHETWSHEVSWEFSSREVILEKIPILLKLMRRDWDPTLKTASILTSSKYLKKEQTQCTSYVGKRERTLTFIITKGAPDHHPPMPPTKAMGAIKQNRRSHPTTTLCLTFWCSNMVGFLRAIERRLRLIGYVFRTKFGWQGDLIPWPNRDERGELVCLSLLKKPTIPQSTVGCLVGWRIGRVTEGGYVCGDGN